MQSAKKDDKLNFHANDASPATPGQLIDLDERRILKQGLKQRHIQMIAFAGTIGTGLFLSSGQVIASAGPAGAMLAMSKINHKSKSNRILTTSMGYSIVGILVSGMLVSIAELSALVPLSGGIIRHAEYFVDPALSFAQGWNIAYAYFISIAGEIVAAAVLVGFWIKLNSAIWITIFGGLAVICNLSLVRIYGELEFSFAVLKILLIIGLNLMALVLVCGGGPAGKVHGAQYWHNPGPFVQYLNIPGRLGQFLGVWSSFTPAVYSFASVENVTILAGETQNPRQNIPKAAKRILARVVIFYSKPSAIWLLPSSGFPADILFESSLIAAVITILMITFIVPSNDPDLLKSTGTAAQSPFVLSAQRAGIKILPSIINAVVLTSAWSSGNSILMGGSRVLFGLAQERHAPSMLKRVSRWGVPYVAVSIMSLSVCLGYLTSNSAATIVFTWLQDLIAAYNYVAWMVICVVYLRFYYAMQKQGITRDELPWKAPFQPYAAWASLIGFFLLLLTSGFRTFIHKRWSTQTFISSYLDITILAALYFGYKFWRKSRIIPLDEVPLRYYIDQARQNQEPSLSRKGGWHRLNILWG